MRRGADDEPFAIDGGSVEWGHEVAVGFFAQDHRATIQPGLTVLDWLQEIDPTAGTEELRGLLGQMLFLRDEGMKPTEALSGGEAARLIFCKLMLQKPNVLVLDEPTNHLDLESINALNIALQKYDGTMFLVTHDHDLLEEVATENLALRRQGHRRLQGRIRGIPDDIRLNGGWNCKSEPVELMPAGAAAKWRDKEKPKKLFPQSVPVGAAHLR